MNYRKELESKTENGDVGILAAGVASLTTRLAGHRGKLGKEKENCKALEQRLAKLKSLAGVRLTTGQNSAERYRRDLTRLERDLSTSRAIVGSYETEVLPVVEKELATAKGHLRECLLMVVEEVKPVCEKKLAELLGDVLDEQADFVLACEEIFQKCGADFDAKARAAVEPAAQHARPDPQRTNFLIITSMTENRVDEIKPMGAEFQRYKKSRTSAPKRQMEPDTSDTSVVVADNLKADSAPSVALVDSAEGRANKMGC